MKSANIFVQAILNIVKLRKNNFDPTDENKSGHINPQILIRLVCEGGLFLSPEKNSNTVSMFYTCITIEHRSLEYFLSTCSNC